MAEEFDLTKLLGDRNFQSLLAGIGTGLDPQGIGGAIGKPTQQMIQAKGAQEATAAQGKRNDELMKLLARALGGDQTAFTDKTQFGPTTMKTTKDNITLDITPESAVTTAPATGGATATPATGAVQPSKGFKPSDLIPFF